MCGYYGKNCLDSVTHWVMSVQRHARSGEPKPRRTRRGVFSYIFIYHLMIVRVDVLLSVAFLNALISDAFVNVYRLRSDKTTPACVAALDGEDWISLVDTENNANESPVIKLIREDGHGDVPLKGSTVEIEYTGTLAGEKGWSAQDVVSCWLSELQGLNHLSDIFLEKGVDGSMLMDETKFNDDYCLNELGISNKIQAKKLVMAAKRVAKQQQDHKAGAEFDSSVTRGKNFSFILGGGKVIRAMDLAVSSMSVGERAKLICRSDYAYGSEGLRSAKGDIIVPPFATLCFELKLINAT